MYAIEHGERAGIHAARNLRPDGAHHERGFVAFGGDGADADGLTASRLRPQLLRFAFERRRDDAERRRDDVGGGAVVLLELDHPRVGEVALEAANDAHVCAAPAVDALVVVAHHAQVPGAGAQGSNQPVLRDVGVLEFVHQHVAKALAELASGRAARVFGDAHGQHDQVFEVDGVGSPESALVGFEQIDEFGVEPARAIQVAGALPLALLGMDLREHPARRHAPVVEPALLQEALDHGLLVRLVVDHEALPEPHLVVVSAQEPRTHGMEGTRPHVPGHVRAHELLESSLELAGGLVGERDREDAIGRDPVLRQQVGDAVGDHPCLAAARAGEDQERPIDVGRSVGLRRVEHGSRRHERARGLPRRPAPDQQRWAKAQTCEMSRMSCGKLPVSPRASVTRLRAPAAASEPSTTPVTQRRSPGPSTSISEARSV